MIPALSDDLLARLSVLATAQLGLRFPPDRWSELARGLASAALELGIADLEGWAEDLASGRQPSGPWAAIANHLTISETYFFRQRDCFEALEKEILPARLARRREGGGALRIWSAGCASGEEPYSIAILLQQRFPDLPPHAVVITGTDINSRVLARARRGVYTEWSFRDAPEWLKRGYFAQAGTGRVELLPEIRQRVRFAALNLATPLYPAQFGNRGDFDVIVCRNVLMYFSAEWQERIVRRFHDALTPDGWLIVGPCDVTAAQAAALHLTPVAPGIYHKRKERAALLAPAVPGIIGASSEIPAMPIAAGATPPPMAMPAEPPQAALAPAVETRAPEPEHIVSTPPDEPSAVGRAHTHADRGELEQALAACEQALATDKLNPNLHYLRGCILQEQQRWEDAAHAFRRVLFLDPGAVMAEFGLAALAERKGRPDAARHHFSGVLRLLAERKQGESVTHGDGLTVGRLRDVVAKALGDDAA